MAEPAITTRTRLSVDAATAIENRVRSDAATVSAIVPTIGRPESLRRLLESLVIQTVRPDEVIIADGSSDDQTERLISEPQWAEQGLTVVRTVVQPPHAVRQREAAIALSRGNCLLFLDDDIVLEPDCIEQMVRTLESGSGVAGVMGTFTNQAWPQPRPVWRWYLALAHGIRGEQWHGKVIGPLLRFGFNPVPHDVQPVEWIGTCNSLVRRQSYDEAGGFSDFFLHRCTMNEDVDLGLKLSRVGRIMFCPQARLAHYHAPGGRVAPDRVAEDDLHNRYLILVRTLKRPRWKALGSILTFFLIESIANLVGGVRRGEVRRVWPLVQGRMRALRSIVPLK